MQHCRPEESIQDVTCDFEQHACSWLGWRREYGHAKSGDWYMMSDGEGILLSPLFPAESQSKLMLFSYRPGRSGTLQLRYRSRDCSTNCWVKIWEVKALDQGLNQAYVWHEAKVVIPALAVGLQFMAVGYDSLHSAAVDHLVISEVVVDRPFAELSLGWAHSCLLHKGSGDVRCWGRGAQLGQGLAWSDHQGDEPLEVRKLPPIDLGTGRSARQISAGRLHTAVLLDDGSVKLFGERVGPGGSHVGMQPGQMGDNLPPADLGVNRTALQVAAGDDYRTCAFLDDYTVKCGSYWRIDITMDLGTGRVARQVSFRPTTSTGTRVSRICVLLDDNSVKCFSEVYESPDDVPTVDLGGGHVQEVHGGSYYIDSCALMSSGAAMCWKPRESHVASQVDFNSQTVRQLTSGCALLDDFSVKCWGAGSHQGRLGQENTAPISKLQVGDTLPAIDLGVGRTARHMASSEEHACAVLDDDSIVCWGNGGSGRLGRGDTLTIGEGPNEMGDHLIRVDLPVPNTKASVQVRLRGERMRGQVQVFYIGVCGGVCDDEWDDVDARVVCRHLGLAGGTSISRFGASEGSEVIWMDGLACSGNETNLGHCPFRGWGVHDCTDMEAAGVECQIDAWGDFSSETAPERRKKQSAVWIASNDSMLVFAGEASAHFDFFADVWLYSLPTQSWVQLVLLGSGPSTRSGHSAVWDQGMQELLVFGGEYGTLLYAELWILSFKQNSWSPVSTLTGPAGRTDHSAVWQPSRKAMLVFAGRSGSLLNDLWLYRAEARSWKQLPSAGSDGPMPRSRHAAVWDETTEAMLVFAGWAGSAPLDDLWHFDSWRQQWKQLSSQPSKRAGHAVAWDSASMSLLVHGGTQQVEGEFSYAGDLWNYSLLLDSWTPLAVTSTDYQPAPRTDHGAAWDPDSRSFLVHAGFDASYRSDLWRYLGPEVADMLVVECVLGQTCSVEDNRTFPTGTSFAISENCSMDNFPDRGYMMYRDSRLDFVNNRSLLESGGDVNSSYVYLEPGRGLRRHLALAS